MLKLSRLDKKANDEEKLEDELQGSDVDAETDLEDELEQEGFEEETEDSPKKYKATLEAATPHASAAKDLYSKRRELMSQVATIDSELGKHREVLRALDPKMKHESYADDKELRDYLKPEKKMDDKKKRRKKMDKKTANEVVSGLLKVADILDNVGDVDGVEIVEDALKAFAKVEIPQYDVQTIEKKKREYPDVNEPAPSMSVRNCPDHNGVMMKRVAEGSWQCELDGQMYNWDQGFKDYSGNVYPGARVQSVDIPEVGSRMFENRDMATSKNQK